jgi:hypothetical protein
MKFLTYYFVKIHFDLFFKDKKYKRIHKTVGNKIYLTILFDAGRIRIRNQI